MYVQWYKLVFKSINNIFHNNNLLKAYEKNHTREL